MSWPVGHFEQLLYIKGLQKKLLRVDAGRKTVLIAAYFPPSQIDWERAYQNQMAAELPIPPGTKLCWHDMRTGTIRAYTTVWDRESGEASSGQIYPYSQRQNQELFRFLGNIDVAGYLRGDEDNNPAVHFGLDIDKRMRQRILSLEIFFSISMPVDSVTNYLYLNYGDIVTQVDVSGVLYRQLEGGLSQPSGISAAATNSSVQTGTKRAASWGMRPISPSLVETPVFGQIKIINPFGARTEDSRPEGFAQTSVMGYVFAPNSAYQDSGANRDRFEYRQFAGLRLTNLNLDQEYRIFQTTDNTGDDDSLARRGSGVFYGYFDEAIDNLEEYS